MNDLVRAALQRIPLLRGLDDLQIKRLGGLTNLVFQVQHRTDKYILRIAGEGTADYIDRPTELYNARVAADVGVSANILFADSDLGLILMSHLDSDVTMTADLFNSRPGAPGRAATALKSLHTSGRVFQGHFELFSMIDEYLAILAKHRAPLPDGYGDIVAAAGPVRDLLKAVPLPLAPCHCDPLCENFLDTGSRMWIVDWEYSGMNDPFWDLGDLSVEGGFNLSQDMEMLSAYCGGTVTESDYGRTVIYKAMCDLLWTLWGLIQHVNDNPADDFWRYAIGRFERCTDLMGNHEFDRHIAAVRRHA